MKKAEDDYLEFSMKEASAGRPVPPMEAELLKLVEDYKKNLSIYETMIRDKVFYFRPGEAPIVPIQNDLALPPLYGQYNSSEEAKDSTSASIPQTNSNQLNAQ